MPIDLPPGSLGPKPTKKQMELLRKMSAPGAVVHTWEGIRSPGGAYIRYDAPGKVETEKVSRGDVGRFHDWGWLECVDPHPFSYKGHDFRLTERALKVIQKGETR